MNNFSFYLFRPRKPRPSPRSGIFDGRGQTLMALPEELVQGLMEYSVLNRGLKGIRPHKDFGLLPETSFLAEANNIAAMIAAGR